MRRKIAMRCPGVLRWRLDSSVRERQLQHVEFPPRNHWIAQLTWNWWPQGSTWKGSSESSKQMVHTVLVIFAIVLFLPHASRAQL